MSEFAQAEKAGAHAAARLGIALGVDTTPISVGEAVCATRELSAIDRQNRAFDVELRQKQLWFRLQLAMGWTAYVLLLALNVYALATRDEGSHFVAGASAAAVLGQSLGLCVYIWRRATSSTATAVREWPDGPRGGDSA